MSRFATKLISFVLLAALSTSRGSRVLAQEATGRITSVIYDPSGAVIPDAQITTPKVATHIPCKTTSDSSGFYQVLAQPIGYYTVSVTYQGFTSETSAWSKLESNQTLKIGLKMQVGSTRDSMKVESGADTVETINPTLGSTVSDRAVPDRPLNGRNAPDLALYQFGVFPADNPGNGSGGSGGLQFSIGRGRSDSHTVVVNGGLNTHLLDNGVVYHPDSIQEFEVLTSDLTAEDGRNLGEGITEVTKGRTNAIHAEPSTAEPEHWVPARPLSI